jgi:acylglycerol lipase
VYAMDLRGRGNSDGERFYVETFEDYVRDVEAVTAIVKSREPGLPMFLPAPDFALAVFKGLSHIAPHAHVLHLPNERFSRDPEAVEAMNNDPLIAYETQPTQTMAAMVRADERLRDAPCRSGSRLRCG